MATMRGRLKKDGAVVPVTGPWFSQSGYSLLRKREQKGCPVSQDKKPAVDLTEKTLEERLEAHGFLTIKDAGPDVLDQAVKDFAQDYWTIPEASTKDVYRSAVLKLLKGVVSAPGRLIDGALAEAKPEDTEAVESGYTESSNVIDLLNNEGEKSYLIDGPKIVTDIAAEDGWSREKIENIWMLPKQELVEKYLDQGVDSSKLWAEMAAWFKGKVVLPDPEEGWADLLSAWTLSSHRHQEFNYLPLLYLPGEPERGKTRLGKAIAYLSYRAVYTPSITPATVVRWRDWFGVTLLLDVGDVNVMLERGEMADLVLNSFEKDGRVSKVMHPDLDPWDQVESFSVYGPTIILSNHQLHWTRDNTRTRCIEINLPEAGHRSVPDAVTPRDKDAQDLYAKIVAYSALTHNIKLGEVDVPLPGRLKDIARPLLQIAQLANPGAKKSIIEVLRKQHQKQKADKADDWNVRVADALWNCRDRVKEGRLFISELRVEVNKGREEREWLTAVHVGNVTKQLGLSKGKGGSTGTTYVNWPDHETAKAIHDRYSQKGYPEPPESPEPIGTQGESGQDTSTDSLQSLQITSSTESPENTTSTGGSGHTGDTATCMSRLDAPTKTRTTASDNGQMDLPMTPNEEDDPEYTDKTEREAIQDEAY